MNVLPIVVSLILDTEHENILLINRANRPFVGYYGFPGGKVEIGERLNYAIQREIYEETGIQIDNFSLLAVVNESLIAKKIVTDHFVLFYFISNIDRIDITVDMTEGIVNWYPLESLPSPVIPSDSKILVDYLNSIGNKGKSEGIGKTHCNPILMYEGKIDTKNDEINSNVELIEWEKLV